LLDKVDEILPPVIARLEQELINVFGEDWAKTWHINLPTHEETPNNVNIPMILWLRNLAIAYDMLDYAQMRYNLLGNGGHWFPGNKCDRINQIDLQKCLINSPHADKIPQILAETHQILAGETVQRLSST